MFKNLNQKKTLKSEYKVYKNVEYYYRTYFNLIKYQNYHRQYDLTRNNKLMGSLLSLNCQFSLEDF